MCMHAYTVNKTLQNLNKHDKNNNIHNKLFRNKIIIDCRAFGKTQTVI
uniref:Uncharacterized protein n=1 Tax=Anguilla anguilla TaxID=7936 RepID=A0A0E9S1D2_ANGAN